MGHSKSSIFQFYINPQIKCDVMAAFLEQSPDKPLMKALGSMGLTCDPQAPKGLTEEESRKISSHPTIARLRQKRDEVSVKIRAIDQGHESSTNVGDPRESLLDKRDALNRELHRRKKQLRDRAEKAAREKYFRENDTRELEKELNPSRDDPAEEHKLAIPAHRLRERAQIAEMLSKPFGDLAEPEQLDQRLDFIRCLMKLCSRREARRQITVRSTIEKADVEQEESDSRDKEDPALFSLKCDPRQCLFCIGDAKLPFFQRVFCFCRPSKMIEHAESHHLHKYELGAKIACPHPICQEDGLVLEGKLHFFNHAQVIHGIKHRKPKPAIV